MSVKPIPDGYDNVIPYLTVDDGKGAIEFYKRAFGATERGSMASPDGRIAHAELEIGDSTLMLSDPFPQASTRPPKELGGTSVNLFMYVEDVDTAFKRALDAGATETMPLDDMFWGDRFGTVTDPYGHTWSLATHVEDVSPEEMAKRGEEAMAAMTASTTAGTTSGT
jgi:PhnB protein